MSIYTEEARRLALCLIKDRPMGMSLAEAGQVILDALGMPAKQADQGLLDAAHLAVNVLEDVMLQSKTADVHRRRTEAAGRLHQAIANAPRHA